MVSVVRFAVVARIRTSAKHDSGARSFRKMNGKEENQKKAVGGWDFVENGAADFDFLFWIL